MGGAPDVVRGGGGFGSAAGLQGPPEPLEHCTPHVLNFRANGWALRYRRWLTMASLLKYYTVTQGARRFLKSNEYDELCEAIHQFLINYHYLATEARWPQ